MKVTLLTVLMIALVTLGFAFESTLTLKGGISQAETDIYQDKQINGMIGLSYEIWLAKWISLGLHPYFTKVGAGKEGEINFEANVVGADMLFRLRPNWKYVAPYITAGGGISNFYPKSIEGVYYPGTEHTVGVLPTVGAGLNFFTKYGIDFDLGFQKNFLMSDELEGWEKGNFNDSYWMAFLGISHTFGKEKPAPVVIAPPPVVVPEAPKPMLTITPNTRNVGYQKGETEFEVKANNPWTVSENETWLTVRPTSGTGNGIIEVMYDENTRPEPRTGNIYVSGGGLNLTLKVIQEGNPIPPLSLRNVYFEFDKQELTPAAVTTLNAIVANLAYYPDTQLEIQGHADEMGSMQYNQRLSERRANAVKDFLVGKGIASSRLTTRGYGETKPATSNDTDEGRALNRRVEFMQK